MLTISQAVPVQSPKDQPVHVKRSILFGAVLALTLPAIAHAAGTLAISAVTKVPASSSHPAEVLVSGTCVQGAGPVKIFFKDTASSVATKVYTSTGNCGATASTSGSTVTLLASVVPPGSYVVVLKQGGALSAPFGPVTLP